MYISFVQSFTRLAAAVALLHVLDKLRSRSSIAAAGVPSSVRPLVVASSVCGLALLELVAVTPGDYVS